MVGAGGEGREKDDGDEKGKILKCFSKSHGYKQKVFSATKHVESTWNY